ncbi:hypothetical protein [Mahella sp.]|uniref:hypothetical protein n=1 Tax=Mahella sp. TaxID=2798721 RepID=UPI0025C41745|nr:hypothetical protein [Mahella sp.]MBZ4665296.1 hypothetical protein [Mahella sp.]
MKNEITAYYSDLPEDIKMFFDHQYYDAYALIDAVRNPHTGLYSDAYMTLADKLDRRCSIAATGVGLIALCIADIEGWDDEAVDKAMLTLHTVTGRTAECQPERDKQTGFFYHFIDAITGINLHSEVSTIDTALLVIGALFTAKHFRERVPELVDLALELLKSIDWRVVVADKEKGAINMVIDKGKGEKPILPYSEYVLVAYLARLAQPNDNDIKYLWEHAFAKEKIECLPRNDFHGFAVLKNALHNKGEFLSSFVHQFPFYLVYDYSTSEVYRHFYKNACLVDRLSWEMINYVPSYVWGYGAGSNDGLFEGYHADAINDNPKNIASAYIVAGFLPVYPAGIYDLYALYCLHIPYNDYKNISDKKEQCEFRAAYRYGLHRYSWQYLNLPHRWYPQKVTVIDWSSMLYGLCALKRGMAFFTERNDGRL